jgi:TPR repeat protein
MRLGTIPAVLIGSLFLGLVPCHAQSPNAARLFELGMTAMMGVGPDRNEQAALDNFRRSAQLGFPPAEVLLGYFYDTGTIVTKDPGQAADWYKKAAQQDDPVAEWLLGRLIFMGAVPRDLTEAARWLQKAAAHNDPFGEYLLGKVKLDQQDYVKAAELFRKAALQGLPQAQQQLGFLLKQGQGVNLDKSEAYTWLLVSYDAGNQSAAVANSLAQLDAELGSNQTQLAKGKARDIEQTSNRVIVARGCTGWPGEFDAIPAPPPPDIQNSCR